MLAEFIPISIGQLGLVVVSAIGALVVVIAIQLLGKRNRD